MKRLFAIALLLSSFDAHPAHVAVEPMLTDESKIHLTESLSEALRSKDITQQQYEEAVSWVNANPCIGVDRSLTSRREAQLEAAIARERKRKAVKVFESFKSKGWFILFTDASEGDEPYLFYSTDPLEGGHPVAAWSGAALIFETSEMKQWAKDNAPNIPDRLASCFAWHVTLGPE